MRIVAWAATRPGNQKRCGYRSGASLALRPFDRHAVELKLVADQCKSMFAGDALLQFLDFLVAELDDAASIDVDQVVVMALARLLVASPPGAEIVPFENALCLEQPQCTIHR